VRCHFVRDGYEIPAWLKSIAVWSVVQHKQNTMKQLPKETIQSNTQARTTKSGSHPMVRKFGGVVLVVLCLLLFQCDEPTVEPMGCARGVHKITGHIFLRCCTRSVFDAWPNETPASVAIYNDHVWTWTQVSSCEDCK